MAELEEHFQKLFNNPKITIHVRSVAEFEKYPFDYQIMATMTSHPKFMDVKELFE